MSPLYLFIMRGQSASKRRSRKSAYVSRVLISARQDLNAQRVASANDFTTSRFPLPYRAYLLASFVYRMKWDNGLVFDGGIFAINLTPPTGTETSARVCSSNYSSMMLKTYPRGLTTIIVVLIIHAEGLLRHMSAP